MDTEITELKEININYDSLLKQGFVVIDLRYKDYDISKENYNYVITRIENNNDDYYSNMLKNITGKTIENSKIYSVWNKILLHKYSMSKLLKRDISIKVAALDFIETNQEF